MTKIYFDETSLERFVQIGLDYSIKSVRDAFTTSGMLNIPYDFKYKEYLKKLNDGIKQDLNDLITIDNLIKNSSKNFSNIKENMTLDIEGIENYSVLLRQSSIK